VSHVIYFLTSEIPYIYWNNDHFIILSAGEDPNEYDCHQTHDSNSKLPDTKSDINTERTHILTDSNNDISDDEIISLVLQECKKGDEIQPYISIYLPADVFLPS
jgi:hypothetical protein